MDEKLDADGCAEIVTKLESISDTLEKDWCDNAAHVEKIDDLNSSLNRIADNLEKIAETLKSWETE